MKTLFFLIICALWTVTLTSCEGSSTTSNLDPDLENLLILQSAINEVEKKTYRQDSVTIHQYFMVDGDSTPAIVMDNGTGMMARAQQSVSAYWQQCGLEQDFIVQVREPGKEQQTVVSYPVKVDDISHLQQGTINTGRVRPLSYGIAPQINGNTLTFTK